VSAIAVLIDAAGATAAVIERMLDAMTARGAGHRAARSFGSIAIGGACNAWERTTAFAGQSAPLATLEGLAIAGDATLYHRADLRRALRSAGIDPRCDDALDLILDAYRAWGAACVERLEGDFAFALWDADRQTLLCARDFSGHRPLFIARTDDRIVMASTVGGVLAAGVPDDLDAITIAATAANLWSAATGTAFRLVKPFHAGTTLEVRPPLEVRTGARWLPPPVRERPGLAFDEAAVALRDLLATVVAERCDPAGPTAVWLSGGRDSTAIFGAGHARPTPESRQHLLPVSISYPEGDAGREDAWIGAVAAMHGAPVHWIPIADIPLVRGAEVRAATRDDVFAHIYECWNRALARGSSAAGARVALGGYGGDQLFHTSEVYLSDLFWRGRPGRAVREWKRMGGRGWRSFVRWVVLPAAPASIVQAVTLARRGRRVLDYLERPLPPWLRQDFAARHGLAEHEQAALPGRPNGRRAADETHFYLACPYFPRILSVVCGLALDEGVELRSPLFDRRLIEFAVGRPREERNDAGDTKRLLRRSMQGLLPAEVLAARLRKTGLTSSYFDRGTQTEAPELFEAAFRDPVLAEFGIVDADRLRERWTWYRRGGGADGVALVCTLHTELWLAARLGRGPGVVRRR
jgi:asparagine synthase (glutamine-hydrolysing)